MRESSIVFSAEDVRATLSGRKTQFRRQLTQGVNPIIQKQIKDHN